MERVKNKFDEHSTLAGEVAKGLLVYKKFSYLKYWSVYT